MNWNKKTDQLFNFPFVYTRTYLSSFYLSTFGGIMFKNYIKIAIRNIRRNKLYSIVNIFGLAVGLTISLIISLYVIDDLTFDHFHENAENTYRLLTIEDSEIKEKMTYSITAGPLVLALKEQLPEVKYASRMFLAGRPQISRADKGEVAQEDMVRGWILLADKDFFKMFDFEILEGDPEKFNNDPNGVFISDEFAQQLFGSEDPLKKPLNVRHLPDAYVMGVIKKHPMNSHIIYDLIIPLRAEHNPMWWDSWENLMLSGYIQLNPGADWKTVENKMVELSRKNNFAEIYEAKLQPFLDIHLGSSEHMYDGFNRNKNDKTVVYSLLIIGIMILFIAAINFINLSSARSTKRAREVGLRKVVGSDKRQLFFQFIGESIILTLISMVLAGIIAQISMPYLDTLLGKHIDINFLANPEQLILFLLIAVFIGFLSGIYPALILSNFQPVTVLKGEFTSSKIGTLVRRILVVCQFTITITLITAVLIVHLQIQHLNNLDMGYNKEQVIVIPDFNRQGNYDLLKEEIRKLPFVQSIGRSGSLPGNDFVRYEVIPEGMDRSNSQMFQRMFVDEELMQTLLMTMVDGRGYSKGFASDTLDAVIVNETAVKLAGWKEPIGRRLDIVELDGSLDSKRVIGVIKDFHFSNTRQAIEPMAIHLNSRTSGFILAKLSAGDVKNKLDQIGEVYKKVYPARNFHSIFLDEIFNEQFDDDKTFADNISLFSAIAILIACLGLLGLVAFSTEQRKREIAIRKVLGSEERRIIYLLTSDFLKWVLIANIFAWPITYFGINVWLDNFVYTLSIPVWPFIVSGLATLIIALSTISYQSIRAARTNPVENLRRE